METRELPLSDAVPSIPDSGGLAPAAPPATTFQPYWISVDRYHKMVETGCIGEHEPVFLWKGQLVKKMTKGHRHNNSSAAIVALMPPLLTTGWHLRPEQSAVLGNDSAPEPDYMIVRGRYQDYAGRHVSSRDVALIIEIADSSLAADSGEVLEKYAAEGIPVYWIVDLPHGRIEMFSHPEGNRYAEHRTYGPDQEISVILDGREVGRLAVVEVLP